MLVTKFESLKIIYLISNYRKSISINSIKLKIQIKCILLVVTKFESLKLIYLISNYRFALTKMHSLMYLISNYGNRNECKFQIKWILVTKFESFKVLIII